MSLRHVMTVGKWHCDVVVADGQRRATVLKENNEVESQLIWAESETNKGLVFTSQRNAEAVPEEVLDWLRTGQQEITEDLLDEALSR